MRFNWKDKEVIAKAIEGAHSQSEILRRLGFSGKGGSFRTLKKWAEIHGLDLPDGNSGTAISQRQTLPIEEILVENSTYRNSNRLKKKLISLGYLKNMCYENCGVDDNWNGKPLVLHLDHINGDNTDNRLENLRILCPNCHSQTETWGTKVRPA